MSISYAILDFGVVLIIELPKYTSSKDAQNELIFNSKDTAQTRYLVFFAAVPTEQNNFFKG